MEGVQIEKKLFKIPEKLGKVEDCGTNDEPSLNKSSTMTKISKNRRGRREVYRPYYQLSEGERHRREEKERMRVVKLREQMRAKGRIIAPYNTTQFLMADHPEDTLELSFIYKTENSLNFPSSQSDEDFMSMEFKKDYDIQQMNRLEQMSKEMLLNEYVLMEKKNETLEARLEDVKVSEEINEERGGDPQNGKAFNEEDLSEKIVLFRKEMESLFSENKRLSNENAQMKKRIKQNTSSSSSSDNPSSSSSSSSSSSESSEEECNDNE